MINSKVATHRPRPLIRFAFTARNIDLVVEIRIVDMHLVGIDTDDGPVLIVEFGDFPRVPAAEKDIVVELVPEGEGS